jgi:hypothetical protein
MPNVTCLAAGDWVFLIESGNKELKNPTNPVNPVIE